MSHDGNDLIPLPHATWNLRAEEAVHGGLPYVGHRISIVAHTAKHLYSDTAKPLLARLEQLGFPLPRDSQRVIRFPNQAKRRNSLLEKA